MVDRVEVDMLILPEQFLPVNHPSQELFRDTYACIVWTGNREVGESLTPDQYLALPHVAMRFTSQPDDSLEDWIFRQTGRTRRVEVTTRAYGLIPHFIVNTPRMPRAPQTGEYVCGESAHPHRRSAV